MRVRNVHRRAVQRPDSVADLIDGLASADDRLWPRDRWPAMRLDQPLGEGARGGHGPIGYRVTTYEPGQRVRFQFTRPRGFHGFHEFQLIEAPGAAAELEHVLEAEFHGAARVSWRLLYRPLHDALIEDALDNAERVGGGDPRPSSWTPYVRALRRGLSLTMRARAPVAGDG